MISIFAVVKGRVENSKCIFMLFFGICPSFFGVFIRAILERVCQSCNIYNASPFWLCSFESINQSINQSINLSIYLSICLSTNLSIRSDGPSFLKAVSSAETVLSKPLIVKFRFKQRLYANFIGLCRYVPPSKMVELDLQSSLLSLCFKW